MLDGIPQVVQPAGFEYLRDVDLRALPLLPELHQLLQDVRKRPVLLHPGPAGQRLVEHRCLRRHLNGKVRENDGAHAPGLAVVLTK